MTSGGGGGNNHRRGNSGSMDRGGMTQSGHHHSMSVAPANVGSGMGAGAFAQGQGHQGYGAGAFGGGAGGSPAGVGSPSMPDVADPLTGLDMSHMGIRFLSTAVFSYTHLTALYLNNNNLSHIPIELGKLSNLSHLDISSNRLTMLHPMAIGNLQRLEQLNLVNNPMKSPPTAVVDRGIQAVMQYLRERLPTQSPIPDRLWVPNPTVTTPPHMSSMKSSPGRFKVLCYNVLAESYATQTMYRYCPQWALAWSYRKTKLLREIIQCDADILCLQEVELGQFDDFFQPELYKNGYSGVFQPKSRAKTMTEYERGYVDGCAIFYRTSKFSLVEEFLFEFANLAMSKPELSARQDSFNRLITKDNIAISVCLEFREGAQGGAGGKGGVGGPGGYDAQRFGYGATGAQGSKNRMPPLLVVNSHIHWNPMFSDVKVMQTQLMLEELTSRWNKGPMLVCGDFNSMPDSGVYELLANGYLSGKHSDLQESVFGSYGETGFRHDLRLRSGYREVLGAEPSFTNYTADFVGSLDYIFFTHDTIQATGVLEPPSLPVVKKNTALPNPQFPSDHISLLAEFELAAGGSA